MKSFWHNVAVKGPDECWLWKGYKRPNNGYAQFGHGGKNFLAHRYAYALEHGSVPSDKMVLHSCDNKACCNPKHLRLGTIRDNTDDALERGQYYKAARTRAKLSEDDVRYIRKSFLSQEDLAHQFDVSQGTISRIKSRVRQGEVL